MTPSLVIDSTVISAVLLEDSCAIVHFILTSNQEIKLYQSFPSKVKRHIFKISISKILQRNIDIHIANKITNESIAYGPQ